MAYAAAISRSNPSCFLFLIDQSGSMDEVMNPTNVRPAGAPHQADGKTYTHVADGPTKAQSVADAINRLLQTLTIKCAKSEGIRDYFDVGVVGYGGEETESHIAPAMAGVLAGRDLAPISEIANNPARIDERVKKVADGAGGLVEQKIKLPIWFDAVAKGGTPMCAALRRARSILEPWVLEHPDSFPPIIINITDGESTDGDPSTEAFSLRSLSTRDGNALFFNVHISSRAGSPIELPSDASALPDDYAKTLFHASSVLAPAMISQARLEGMPVTDQSRGFVYNAAIENVIQFLVIGTRPSNLR
jgi:hypothetical protein